MSITLTALQKQRRDTAANWTTANPTLLAGEIGIESDTGYWKVGDGSTAWTSLAYLSGLGAEIPVSRLADGTARQLLQTDAAGTGVEWASNIDVPGTLDVTGASTFDADVTIQGDLTVNGTTTTIDTQNLIVEDKNIEIGKVATPTDVTADGGGITLKGSTDKTINWVDATDAWTFSEHVNIASAKEYRIAGTKVLDATSLGSGVVSSSLTSVGTIGTGTWQGTAINKTYLDATLVSTGDTGTVTSAMIANGTIVNEDINASAAIAGTKISPDFGSQTIATTGIVSHALGTAGAPTVTFTGDTNTGIYSPGADQVAISTNGAGRLFIDSQGRAGIGVVNPGDYWYQGNNLVVSAINAGITIAADTTQNSSLFFADGTIGNAAYRGWVQYLHASDSLALGTSGTERARITSDGKLGLGTSTPQLSIGAVGGNVLHVAGAGTTGLRIQNTGGNSVDIYAGTDGFINQSGSGTLNFQLAGSTKATLTSTGLGIGTTSPSNTLHVKGALRVEDSGSSAITRLFYDSIRSSDYLTVDAEGASGFVSFRTGSVLSERGRWDSSGRLLVGTSTARGVGTSYSFPIQNENTTAAGITFVTNSNDAESSYLILGKSRGTSVGSSTVVQANDVIGRISFAGADGTDLETRAATIEAQVDGTPGANDMPGRLVFSTTADGASSPTERMRISQGGKAQMFANANDNVLVMRSAEGAGTATYVFAGVRSATGISDGTVVFGVFTNGNAVNTNNSYGAISDLKLKENVVDAGSQWDDLKALQVRKYNFKEGQTHTQIGLVAQEAELVSPGLVSESPDRDAEGNDLGTVTKSVNYSVLYMKAVKALQEAMERIETLEAKVTALEAS